MLKRKRNYEKEISIENIDFNKNVNSYNRKLQAYTIKLNSYMSEIKEIYIYISLIQIKSDILYIVRNLMYVIHDTIKKCKDTIDVRKLLYELLNTKYIDDNNSILTKVLNYYIEICISTINCYDKAIKVKFQLDLLLNKHKLNNFINE